MQPEAVPLAYLVFHICAQLDIDVGFDNEIQIHLNSGNGDPVGLGNQWLIIQFHPVAFLLQHLLVTVHQLFHAGFGFCLIFGAEHFIKGSAHIFGTKGFLQLFNGILYTIHLNTGQLLFIALDLCQDGFDFLTPRLHFFHFCAQFIDFPDSLLDTGIIAYGSGKVFPLLDVFLTDGIHLSAHRHIGVILDVDGCRHINIFQNRDNKIPFPSVIHIDIKVQCDLLLKAGSQLDF